MKPIKFLAICFVIFLGACADKSVSDKTQPYIRLYGKRIDTVSLNAIYKDETAEADGCKEVTITGSVNTAVPGIYYIDYDYTDPQGNRAATVTRTVHVLVTNNDSLQFLKAFRLFEQISISKRWRTNEKDGKEISINLKTQPVIYLEFKEDASISSYMVTDVKNRGASLELQTKKLICDSVCIWNFMPTDNNKGDWSISKPQINYKLKLGKFTSVYE